LHEQEFLIFFNVVVAISKAAQCAQVLHPFPLNMEQQAGNGQGGTTATKSCRRESTTNTTILAMVEEEGGRESSRLVHQISSIEGIKQHGIAECQKQQEPKLPFAPKYNCSPAEHNQSTRVCAWLEES
jgi:hypothetical protein